MKHHGLQGHPGQHQRGFLVDGANAASGRQEAAAALPQNCEEAFYVLDGEVDFSLGTAIFLGRLGAFVLVPGGVAHTFGNAAPAPARVLVIHAPAMDAYFEELQALWSGEIPPNREAEIALMKRHGMEPATVK